MPAPISVVVLSFDRPECLIAALGSVFAQDLPDIEVVVVDNLSPRSPQIADEVARWPRVRFLPQSTNLGFAAGMNVGIDAATGEYIHIMADDIVLGERFYEAILPEARRYPAALFSGILHERPGDRILFVGTDLEIGWTIRRHALTEIPGGFGDSYSTGMLMGASLFGSREAFFLLGGFRPEFFVGHEDVDLSWRARRAGVMLRVVPAARAWHFYPGPESFVPSVEFHKLKNSFALGVLYMPPLAVPLHILTFFAYSSVRRTLGARRPGLLLRVWGRCLWNLPKYLIARLPNPKGGF